jgi:hypothetical protein
MEKKLKEAIKLLEELYHKVHYGAVHDSSGLSLLDDKQAQNDIVDFIESTGKKTKLKRNDINNCNRNYWIAC